MFQAAINVNFPVAEGVQRHISLGAVLIISVLMVKFVGTDPASMNV